MYNNSSMRSSRFDPLQRSARDFLVCFVLRESTSLLMTL